MGLKGDMGVPGQSGNNGSNGETGPTGSQGIQGPTGNVSITDGSNIVVDCINNQIINGQKTFIDIVNFINYTPQSNILPTEYNDLANKSYVDSLIGAKQGTGLYLYLNQSQSSDITGFKSISTTCNTVSGYSTITTSSLGNNLIEKFITPVNIPYNYGSSIKEGLYTLYMHMCHQIVME